MKPSYLILSSLWLLPGVASSGPEDVRGWDTPLQPHHRLELPPPKEEYQLPEPDFQLDSPIEDGQILISESASLLARQGTRTPEEAHFRASVWQFFTQSEAVSLLSDLPEQVLLPPLRRRLIALLLLEAEPPRQATDRWLSVRLAALQRLGATDEATALLSAIPPSLRENIDPKRLYRFFLKSGQSRLACEALEGAVISDLEAVPQWQRARLFCHAVQGQYSQIELASALAEERGNPFPAWFMQLVESFQYDEVMPPESSAGPTQIDRLSIQAARLLKSLPEEEKEQTTAVADYPETPAYAVLAIAQLIREERLEETVGWLDMLDRNDSRSASSYVLHELVRFLEREPDQPQSDAARTLPPFTGAANASEAEVRLLQRFYRVMEAFDYQIPAVTEAWLAELPASGDNPVPPAFVRKLTDLARAGNKAGYLLRLSDVASKERIARLSDSAVRDLLLDMNQLRESEVARQFAAEAILAELE